jgi:FkbM family methyltransferase
MALRSQVDRPLIFDIGAHDGEDTAFYLSRGARVVAVDADQRLTSALERRFATTIESGQLQTVTRAVAEVVGRETDFYLHENSGLNSLSSDIGERGSSPVIDVARVTTTTLAALVDEFGVPDYCKVDVEGHDAVAVASLGDAPKPKFISAEAESLPEECPQSLDRVLDALMQQGYDRFKLVDQRSLRVLSLTDTLYAEYERPVSKLQRLLYRRLPGFVWSPYWWERRQVTSRIGYELPHGSTGPYGNDLAGEWCDATTAAMIAQRQRAAYFSTPNSVPWGFWCDWHATMS